jgi:hypothetical protein
LASRSRAGSALPLFWALFQIVAMIGGFVLGMVIVAALPGQTVDTTGGTGIGAGAIIAGLFGGGRLSKRWTGEFAFDVFGSIPPRR